ncbi:hypothetical protein PAXINDRAFT_83870 [Paxillus involutus ATCC 200175]|uniref:Uncharacterized protein n=1 Tax=Paxillus involutus ATCC 200175 TaxID=664439 RepID=A0A0C9TMP6_PAXIN|nr:hypothetical protein PAXINDRAFT_83870 [Paxillus involutus ATCC 200175]
MQVKMIKMLIDNGADIHARTSNEDSVLHIAIQGHPHVAVVKLLVDSGCNPAVCNSDGQTPLHIAAIEGHTSIVKYMLSLDIPLPPDILLSAARVRPMQVEMIKILIDKGADVHTRTSGGDSVLDVAMSCYQDDLDRLQAHWRHLHDQDFLKAVEILDHSGCDPAVCNPSGKMRIHVAVATRCIDIRQQLLALYRAT